MTVAEVRDYAGRTAAELALAGIAPDVRTYTEHTSRQVEVRRGILQRSSTKIVTDSHERTIRGWLLWEVKMTISEVHLDSPPHHSGWSDKSSLWLFPDGTVVHIQWVADQWGPVGPDSVRSMHVATDGQIITADTAFHQHLYGPQVPKSRKGNYKTGLWESHNHGRNVPPLPEGMRVSRALTDLRKRTGTHPKSPQKVSRPVPKTASAPSPAIQSPSSPALVTAPGAMPVATLPTLAGAVPRATSTSLVAKPWFGPAAAVSGIILVMVAVIGVAGASNRSLSATGFTVATVKGLPIRWNPCAGPISIQVNYGRLLPAYRQRAQDAVQQGISAINEASGLDLVYRGTTTARPVSASGTNRRTADNAITVGFLPAGTGLLADEDGRDSAAVTSTRAGAQQWRAITAAGIQVRSKAGSYTQEVLWGLARASGLEAVPPSRGPGIMAGNPEGNEYGPGDRAGLTAVGAGQGCID